MNRFPLGAAVLWLLVFSGVLLAESQAEFFTTVAGREAATYADGVRAVALLLDANPTVPSFDEAQNFLREKQIIKKDWSVQADAPLPKGKLAYMLFKTAGLKPGLGDMLFGVSERTAIDECFANDLIAKGKGAQEAGTGMALLMSVQQTAIYREKDKRSTASDLVKIDFDAVQVDVPAEKMEAQGRLLNALAARLSATSNNVSATIVAVDGAAWMRASGKEWGEAHAAVEVPAGAELLTGVNAQVQLAFPDGTVFLAKPMTHLSLVFAGSGTCPEGAFYILRASSDFGTLRVAVGQKSFLSCVQIGSPTSYVTGLDGAFEQTAAGTVSDTVYAGSKGRISVVQGSW